MPSYTTKPPLKLKPATPAPVVEEKPEQEFVSIADLASQGREALVNKMREHMANKPAPPEPPAPTERQKTRTEMEMEAGRRAVLKHETNAAAQLQPKPDPSDGYTVPAYRPGDHVPDFNSKDPQARTLK